ncbi:hypothetical protein [Enterobacter kobei]|uniref:hypothetical protein n=1 Tax=Enterobacter kobei TaxID=208224 RepID=UPI0012BA0DC1|nr:hypothetical protein [Enterobacter kobei]
MQIIKKWWAVLAVVGSSLFMVATMDSKQLIDNYHLAEKWVMSSPTLEGSWSSSYPGEDFEGLSEISGLNRQSKQLLKFL